MTSERGVPSRKNRLRCRRLILIVPILLITVYNLLDFASQRSGTFLQAFESVVAVVTGHVAHSGASLLTNQPVAVDIISVGSLLKGSYQDAQERTFGSHPDVRNFFRVTEVSDFDRKCFTELTTDQLQEIIDFCTVTKGESHMSTLFRDVLFQPKKHAGWMCAQKRPIDGLYHVLTQYRDGVDPPDYLFIIDDDTYMNIDSVTDMLINDFPVQTPHLVAGCNFEFLTKAAVTFPYGGFGSFLTKAAINRLLQPIDCSTKDDNGAIADPFSRLTCWRLKSNLMGEKRFFADGMSVADLMFRFSSEQPFAEVANWKSGFCFHSDHALGYFMNFYHIAVPDDEIEGAFALNDKLREKYKYTALTNEKGQGRRGECSNERERCKPQNHVCHYIQPDQMDELHLAKQIQDAVDAIKDAQDAADAIKVAEGMEN